jgi:hypothetical protein
MSKYKLFFYLLSLLSVLLLLTIWVRCTPNVQDNTKYTRSKRKVEIAKEGNRFVLYRNGEPYFIKGAAGYRFYDRIADYGGNSIRVWHADDAERILDEAHKRGLTVTLGLWLAREKEGFNYYDKESVAAQLEEFREVVKKYKDHPALLMWGVGNELYAEGSNVKVWDAVNEIAEMIHEVDPDHPTTTSIMNVPLKVVNLIADRCPALDVLSINAFGSLNNLSEELEKTTWKGPYIISEFGARGYWESYYTWWMAPIEQTSSEKAAFAKQRYKEAVLNNTDRCLGSYVFMWGNKQETTSTWFSLINEEGEETELVHVMKELWSGNNEFNHAPYIAYLKVNNKFAEDQIYLKPNENYQSTAFAYDPEQDRLDFEWQLVPEMSVDEATSDKQKRPKPLTGAVLYKENNKVVFKTPRKEGAYRLFIYIRDGKNNLATANVPFFVTDTPLH